jgi:hypothetical protein
MPFEKSRTGAVSERTAFSDAVENAANSIVERCGADAPEIASWLSSVMRSLGVDDQAEGWALIADAAGRKVASRAGTIARALSLSVSPERSADEFVLAPGVSTGDRSA